MCIHSCVVCIMVCIMCVVGHIPNPPYQDTQFQDLKRMLYNSDMALLKEMFPEVYTSHDNHMTLT